MKPPIPPPKSEVRPTVNLSLVIYGLRVLNDSNLSSEAVKRNYPPFVETEGSLLSAREPATVTYSEAHESNQHTQALYH